MDNITANQHYSFPILESKSIIQCLSEVGIDLLEAELKEPNRHKEKVKATFASLLQLTQGLDENYFNKHSASVMRAKAKLKYPELHNESLTNFKFFRACRKFMRICTVRDFGLQDLGNPTAKRFKRQLSAAINFIKFREERLGIYAEAMVGREELLKGLFQAKEERKRQMEQLNLAKKLADQRWEEAKTIEEDCAELEMEIAQQNQLQKSLREASKNLKKKANMLKDEIATADLTMQELDAEERKLLPKIVESPDGLHLQIKELNEKLDEERKHLKIAEQEAKTAELRVQNVKQAKDDVMTASKLLSDLDEEKSRYEKLLKETNDIRAVIAANEEKMEHLQGLCEQHKSDIRDIGEEAEKNRKGAKASMDAAQKALQVAKAELLDVEKDRRDAKAALERHEQEVNLIKSIIEEERVKTDEEIKEIIASYRIMEKAALDKQEEFNAKIKASMELTAC